MQGCKRVENVDVSDIIEGHTDYNKKLPDLLQRVGELCVKLENNPGN